MKSLYRRQFGMMVGILLVSFLMLGGAFIAMSYQYLTADKRSNMERNAEYIASFTAAYLSTGGTSVNDYTYQLYVSYVANIADGTVILAENSGEIAFASSVDTEGTQRALQGQVSTQIMDEVTENGGYARSTTLGGILPQKHYVVATPVLQHSVMTGLTYQRGVVFVASEISDLTQLWQDFTLLFLLTTLVVLLLGMALSSVTSHRLTRPLKEMAEAARRFGQGEFDARVTGCSERQDEVGELAEAFNTMADSLAKSEAQRSEFIANVSHELKTPMTTIAGFADGILDGTIPPEKQADALKTISAETRRLSRLVRRMLDLSKLRSNENVTAQERFDISEVLIRVLLSLETKINGRGLDVETDLPEGPVMVWGDPDAITQVCYNLLDNAIKFAQAGTALQLSIQVKGDKALISVADRGETIPPEELSQVFDRFHKLDRSRSEDRDGVGLGLYIVKTIIDNHKESIHVTSEEGLTTFTFTLTLA